MRKGAVKQGVKPIDQPDFKYWQALYLAFFSQRLYIDVVKRWHGFGMIYFLIMMFIISVPWTFYYTAQFSQYLDDEIIFPFERMPPLMIQNGEVSIDKSVPYIIESKSNKPAIEINTTSDLKGFSSQYPTVFFLITKNALYFRVPSNPAFSMPKLSPTGQTESFKNLTEYHFEKNDNQVFSGRDWVRTSGIQSLRAYAALIVFPIVFGMLWGLYFVTSVVLASMGRIIASVVLKYPIGFIDSFRLAWVASTAPIAFVNIVLYVGYNLRGLGWYYITLVAIYFSLAILCVKRESQALVRR